MCLASQCEPGCLRTRLKRDPLLHQTTMTGIKALPGTCCDQRIHPLPRQLDDQLAVDEHGEDLGVDTQSGGARSFFARYAQRNLWLAHERLNKPGILLIRRERDAARRHVVSFSDHRHYSIPMRG